MAEVGYRRLEGRWFDFQTEHARFRRNLAEFVTSDHIGLYYFVVYLILLVEFGTSMLVLTTAWNQPCDSSLKWWLLGYIIKTICWIPVTVFQQKHQHEQHEQQQHNHLQQHVESEAQRRLYNCKSVLSLLSFVWFILGVTLVLGGNQCPKTAPFLFYVSVAWLVLGLLSLLAPLLVYVLIMFCFPVLFAFFQQLAAQSQVPPEVEAAIQALPVKPYVNGLVPADKASCVICSEDYQENAELRFLPCEHHFHKQCSEVWLRMKATCPLCIRSISDSPQPLLTPQQQREREESEALQVQMAQIREQENQV